MADFINEIKSQAMVNAYEQAGFIYEPTSGLYWDSKTGYYYNPQTDLYYDGNKGTWHRLNPITNEFTFHSETEAAKAVKKVRLCWIILFTHSHALKLTLSSSNCKYFIFHIFSSLL